MKKIFPWLILIIAGFTAGCDENTDLKTVQKVEIKKYLGKWYQVAYIPNSFQDKDCPLTTADYSIRNDGDIKVINTCWADLTEKTISDQAEGKAWLTDEKSGSKLKVSFFWPFSGKYWIIDLDENEYQYTVISEPGKEYLWILARSIPMNEMLYKQLLEKIKLKGIPLDKIIRTDKKIKSS